MAEKAVKRKRYLLDGVRGDRYIRAWKEGRGHGEIVVQIWNKPTPEGQPDGDWGMPGILGAILAVDQAIAQTPKA